MSGVNTLSPVVTRLLVEVVFPDLSVLPTDRQMGELVSPVWTHSITRLSGLVSRNGICYF